MGVPPAVPCVGSPRCDEVPQLFITNTLSAPLVLLHFLALFVFLPSVFRLLICLLVLFFLFFCPLICLLFAPFIMLRVCQGCQLSRGPARSDQAGRLWHVEAHSGTCTINLCSAQEICFVAMSRERGRRVSAAQRACVSRSVEIKRTHMTPFNVQWIRVGFLR